MNTNYTQIKTYISSIKKYQIKSIEIDNNNQEIENISINYKLLNEDINNIDKDLISNLIKNKLCKKLFFDKIEDIYVFNQNKFIEVMFYTNEYMEGNYTKYSSDIGLFLKDEDRVQLNFPYKDCVLVGGMDKEDDKINLEVFYNEILEKDKINKLFEPKVFHNIKKYSYNKELSEDDKLDNPNNIQVDNDIDTIEFETFEENGIEKQKLKDNLLIKGNNLLGLHSIARRLSGSIDVIYIDPPYYFNQTKSSDSFAYNSNFKLSTWLTFMKNRLEIARELLSENGTIIIQNGIDAIGEFKLLSDEIFNKNNLISLVTIKTKEPGGFIAGQKNLQKPIKVNESLLIYSKNKNKNKFNIEYTEKNGNWDSHYTKMLDLETLEILDIKETLIKQNIITSDMKLSDLTYNHKKFKKFYLKNKHLIFQTSKPSSQSKHILEGLSLAYKNKGKVVKTFDTNGKTFYFYGKRMLDFLDTSVKRKDGKEFIGKIITDNWIDINFNNLQNEIEKKEFGMSRGQKPILLLKRIIEMFSDENDIVLDFFAGSGTTGITSHLLNRRWIMLEQLDYIQSKTLDRLKSLFYNSNLKIYDNLKYIPYGSFIYMEMKESNIKELKNQIKSSKNKEELISLINDNFNNGYFINIDNKEQLLLKIEDIYNQIENKNITKTKTIEKFNQLFLLESIKLVIEKYMDNNLDYVSYEDIEELKLSNKIKENEYKLNKSFYEEV